MVYYLTNGQCKQYNMVNASNCACVDRLFFGIERDVTERGHAAKIVLAVTVSVRWISSGNSGSVDCSIR